MVSGRGKPLRWTRRRGTPVTWRWRLSGLVGQLHVVDVPQVLRNKAFAFGASEWLSTLDDRIAELEQQWSIQVGEVFDGATEAYVAMAIMSDGSPAVLKVVMPRAEEVMRHEMTVLRLADGQGCVRLLRESDVLGALLLERLGPALSELSVSLRERHEVLCSTVERLWRPAPGCGLPTGAEKGRWLIEFILATWEALNRPCNERAVEDAIACAERRIGAHDDELAMLVHGDVHQWNALRAEEGFKLVDPDGLLAEREYDMGILMREDPLELLDEGPHERARWLARRCHLDARSIWEWGVVERVSTGLLCTQIDLQPVGRHMLDVAERVSELSWA
jgi:streptomycin 6-kinase